MTAPLTAPLVTAPLAAKALDAVFRANERYLWAIGYRMTGSAADADDLVQQTFARAIESPPRRTDEPMRPWLVRVTVNLAKDALRRRRRRGYDGPWLPTPIETPIETEDAALPAFEPAVPLGGPFAGHEGAEREGAEGEGTTTEGRYDLLESVSFAFLLALEALTPTQRAVLLLRDVFDYSVREVAEALTLSEPNVKTTHHRARHALEGYDRRRRPPTAEVQAATREVLQSFLLGLVRQDVAAVEKLLADSVRALSDGAGRYLAARVPIVGAAKVARFHVNISRNGRPLRVELRMLNGLPALLGVDPLADVDKREAPRFVVMCDLDAEGRIAGLYSVLADEKLARLQFP